MCDMFLVIKMMILIRNRDCNMSSLKADSLWRQPSILGIHQRSLIDAASAMARNTAAIAYPRPIREICVYMDTSPGVDTACHDLLHWQE